jgi:CcmD family protein
MLTFLAANLAHAQNETPMADLMRSNGKIYVVVAVIAIIFAGIIVYLVSIDRKTAYLEEELKNLQK